MGPLYVLTLLGLLLGGPAWSATSVADKCEADKLKTAGKYANCRLKTHSKEVKKGILQDEKFAKCDTKYDTKWDKVELKADVKALKNGEPSCPSLNDANDIQARILDDVDDLRVLLSGGSVPECGDGVLDPNAEDCEFGDLGGGTCQIEGFSFGTLACGAGCVFDTSGCTDTRFVDNGDGTVSDNQTGLMWEKKVGGTGCLHCAKDQYSWTDAMSVWISELNGHSDDPNTQSGFAGHTDWRLATVVEMQTLLLEVCSFTLVPCIDPIFGPTEASVYRSSTTVASSPADAWNVDFFSGGVNNFIKSFILHVRAVRGGL